MVGSSGRGRNDRPLEEVDGSPCHCGPGQGLAFAGELFAGLLLEQDAGAVGFGEALLEGGEVRVIARVAGPDGP